MEENNVSLLDDDDRGNYHVSTGSESRNHIPMLHLVSLRTACCLCWLTHFWFFNKFVRAYLHDSTLYRFIILSLEHWDASKMILKRRTVLLAASGLAICAILAWYRMAYKISISVQHDIVHCDTKMHLTAHGTKREMPINYCLIRSNAKRPFRGYSRKLKDL